MLILDYVLNGNMQLSFSVLDVENKRKKEVK